MDKALLSPGYKGTMIQQVKAKKYFLPSGMPSKRDIISVTLLSNIKFRNEKYK